MVAGSTFAALQSAGAAGAGQKYPKLCLLFYVKGKRTNNIFKYLYSYQFAMRGNVSAQEMIFLLGLGAGSSAAIGTAGAVGAVAAADSMGRKRT